MKLDKIVLLLLSINSLLQAIIIYKQSIKIEKLEHRTKFLYDMFNVIFDDVLKRNREKNERKRNASTNKNL